MLLDRHLIEIALNERNGPMNTSKYDTQTRKTSKRDQRTLAYRELQRRTAEERSQLETKLRDRNDAIARLTKRLVEKGVAADEVAQLAKLAA
jgi:uncharacterized protein YlxW (UPF0749 family)